MAVVRHFAINLVRSLEPDIPPPIKPQRKAPPADRHQLRRKIAGWDQRYLANALPTRVNLDLEP
jgi:hypothetical protein